ncbi:MAG: hypothetical protein HYT36_01070 [Candidatus Staskawiczbacteria bacterium]|nr:hypothetical protein [Candidatus Staskawiczbacteria bacterium]
MLIVKETFIAKPGHAGKLAKIMKEEMDKWEGFKGHVMLDFVTSYNKIVVEYEIESLADFDKMMEDWKKEQSKAKSDKPPAYTELYQTGKREIFKIVE